MNLSPQKKGGLAALFGLFFTLISFSSLNNKVEFIIPPGWPAPVYEFSKNPITDAGFQLGRHLFYDPLLSRDSSISCASCHLQATGFTHVDHKLSHGMDGRIGTRNSPAIMNMAWSSSFMWDGGVNHLDMQPINPISSADEMDETMENVVRKLNSSEKYRRMFYGAFGDSMASGQRTLLAMSQFILMLNSYNSKYDKYIRKEAGGAFTEQEANGLRLFRKNCASCHAEPLFTNHSFANNGLAVDTVLMDIGRARISQNPADSLKFKVPTLRNIQFTFPYMHDGRFKKLADVINHYTDGIQQTNTIDKRLQIPIVLSANEKVDLVAFLRTLTDRDFLFDPRFGYPRD